MRYKQRMRMVTDAAESIAASMIHAAQNSGTEPVVFVTGNRYFPALRSYPQAEEIWEADDCGLDLFATMVEILEDRLNDANVLLESPPDDNCLYVVDTARFEFISEDIEAETYSDEWRPIREGAVSGSSQV